MKKEVANLWIAALLSGDYEQAAGTLVEVDGISGDINGYCCLGVLCDLAVKAGAKVDYGAPELIDDGPGPGVHWSNARYDGADALLPTSVREWAGMRSTDGALDLEGDETLAVMNDDGATFQRIAEVISERSSDL